MSRPTVLPAWLAERFPARPTPESWPSLRVARLRVAAAEDGGHDAGLTLEMSRLGVQVERVEATPGQDPALRPGSVVVAIEGHALLGLNDEALVEQCFGAHFRDGAEVLFADLDDVRAAVIWAESNEECPCDAVDADEPQEPVEALANYELLHRAQSSSEYDATVRIPVGRGTVWDLDSDAMCSLREDLKFCGSRHDLSVEAKLNRDSHVECVVLSGLSSAIASARPEVVQILHFYREGHQWHGGDPRADPSVRPGFGGAGAGAGAADAAAAAAWRQPEGLRDLRQFMYHDHTADIIVHGWGKTRPEAFAQTVVGMFQYMTELDHVDVHSTVDVEATGHDLLDLLYHLLDEFLFVFGTEMHVSRYVEILEFDEQAMRIRARGHGEKMDLRKHEQGTEIKAITMHMMKILDADTTITEAGTGRREDQEESSERLRQGFVHEAYVLLDI